MPISAAARTGITRWSAEADPFNRTQTDADHALLDDLVAIDLHDAALAARPAFGTRGRYFTESAASAGLPGTTWREDGTAWRALGSRVLSTGTGDVAQVVAGVTAQSADLVQWRSGASTLGRVDNTGQLFAVGAQLGPSPQTALAAMLGVTPATAAAVAAIIRGAVSQSGDLQQWQSSAGSVLARVDSTGAGTFAGVTTAGTVTGRLARWSSAAVGDVVVQVNGFAGQTGDLQQWRDSTAATLAKVRNDGFLGTAAGLGPLAAGSFIWMDGASGVRVSADAAGSKALVVRGAGSQTANLQEWQNSAGSVLARVDQAGALYAPFAQLQPTAVGNVASVVRGFAGQTANLQEWQNSAGTALAFISAAGGAFAQTAAFGSSLVGGTQVTVKGAAASTLPLLVEGTTGQTQDLIQAWTTGSGPTVFQVAPSGFITTAGGITAAGSATVGGLYNKTLEAYPIGYATASSRVRITDDGTLGYYQSDHQVLFTPIASSDWAVRVDSSRATANVPLSAKGAAGQTGDLQQWQNSSGTTSARVAPNGTLYASGFYGPSMAFSTDSDATVGIGCYSNTNPAMKLRAAASMAAHILGVWSAGSPGTEIAYISATGNVAGTGAYTTLSDSRAKANLRPLELDPLATLRRLRPVVHDYIGGERNQLGFLADEVEPVLPHAVVPFDTLGSTGLPDRMGRLGLRDSAILAVVVAGMQQLERRVDALAA